MKLILIDVFQFPQTGFVFKCANSFLKRLSDVTFFLFPILSLIFSSFRIEF